MLRHTSPVRGSEIERIMAFEDRLTRAQATHIVEHPWGFTVLLEDFPLSEFHNRVVVTSTASAADVLATAEAVLGGAGLRHRYVSVDDALVADLTASFVAAGYEHEVVATMVYTGTEIEPTAHDVRTVSLDTLRPALINDWQLMLPDATGEHLRQLADRAALYARGANLTLLAVYDGDEIAAHADLYVDRVDRIAQFENLATRSDFRGRGYAGALIRDALRRAREAKSELSFLTADPDDWPHEWYRRLGYADAARTHHFSRRD